MGFVLESFVRDFPPARSPISVDDGAPPCRQNSAKFCHFGRFLATNLPQAHRRRVVPIFLHRTSMSLVAFDPSQLPSRQKSTQKLPRQHHGCRWLPWCDAAAVLLRLPWARTPSTTASGATNDAGPSHLTRHGRRKHLRARPELDEPASASPGARGATRPRRRPSSVIEITDDRNDACPRPGTRQRRSPPRCVPAGSATDPPSSSKKHPPRIIHVSLLSGADAPEDR